MNEHKRAEKLCIEAEKLGMDGPSEGMIATAIMHAVSERTLEIEIEIEQEGYRDAARAVRRWYKLKHMEEE